MNNQKKKILIIFYSFENNTKFIAGKIAEETGGDLLKLEPTEEIRKSGFLKYLVGGMKSLFKIKPPLLPLDKNPSQYDLIFLGTPVWAGKLAPVVRSYLYYHLPKDKNIALFSTYRANKGDSISGMKEYLEDDNQILGEKGFSQPLDNKEHCELEARKWAKSILSKN